jgi:hypothetical protein
LHCSFQKTGQNFDAFRKHARPPQSPAQSNLAARKPTPLSTTLPYSVQWEQQ